MVVESVVFTIGDLAKEFGTTPRAIRFYEDKGLIHPERDGQKRIYNAHDRTILKLVMRGKRLGFSLEESRTLIDLYNPNDGNDHQIQRTLDMIETSRQRLRQQQQDIHGMLQELDAHERRLTLA